MLGQRELVLEDYVSMLRRRLWWVVVPTVLGPIIGYSISLFLPEEYTSKTTVLVEQPKVPDRMVPSIVNDDLNERLGTMKEQILSRTRLQPIIEQFGLFKEQTMKLPMEDVVEHMRKNIVITPVRSTVSRDSSVPGFTISYKSSSPQEAQLVCREITSLFIQKNLEIRSLRAEGTTNFLQSQLDEAKRKLDEQDRKLAEFKRRWVGQLPGTEQMNLNILMSLHGQLDALTQQLTRAQQDKTYAESQLGLLIAAWESAQVGTNPQTLDQQLALLKNQLISLEGRYTSDHPDVIKLKADIAQLKKKIDETNRVAREESAPKPQVAATIEPPHIQQLRNQVRVLNQTINEKTRDQERVQAQIKVYQARVQLSPQVEQQYKELTRDFDTAMGFYKDLLGKKTTSEISTQLEKQQQGEQFRILDSANLPASPTFPNRPLFALGGLGGGLGLGLALALLLEFGDKALRTERDIEYFLQLPALALLPSTDEPVRGKRHFWKGKKPLHVARSGAKA
jgi:polysaccharide chain length determinant protein (PEP-CTERM system associated)